MMSILLVDDHTLTREGLRSLISVESDMGVLGEAADGRAAVELAMQLLPNVVLMDVSMPSLNGIEATRRIHAKHPSIRVLGLSMHSRQRYIMDLLDAGACGYMHKTANYSQVRKAIRQVARGLGHLEPGIAESVRMARSSRKAGRLGPREREIVRLLAEGHSSKEIAEILHIAWNTVETHRRNIMQKLNLRGVAALTRYAIREGLSSLE